MVRTALFNWAFARHTGGTFVFRIEDTDAQRDSEECYLALLDALRWLGLDWDEGPEVGGPYGPYRQSLRSDLYHDVVDKLLEAGEAYYSFSTPEEVEARHVAAGRDPKLGYDNFDRQLTDSAARRVPGGGPQTGGPAADARRRPHLARPRSRHHQLRGRLGARLRVDPGQRRSVVHLGQPVSTTR